MKELVSDRGSGSGGETLFVRQVLVPEGMLSLRVEAWFEKEVVREDGFGQEGRFN